MSFRENLVAKAKRTVTKSGAASEPRAAFVKHLHHTVSETQGTHQGAGVGAVHWARHGRTTLDITQIQQKQKNMGCVRPRQEKDAQCTVA